MPSIVETDEISYVGADCLYCSGLETVVVKSGSNGQNSTSGAMKSVWVQMTGKHYFAFSATLNKCSAHLP